MCNLLNKYEREWEKKRERICVCVREKRRESAWCYPRYFEENTCLQWVIDDFNKIKNDYCLHLQILFDDSDDYDIDVILITIGASIHETDCWEFVQTIIGSYSSTSFEFGRFVDVVSKSWSDVCWGIDRRE